MKGLKTVLLALVAVLIVVLIKTIIIDNQYHDIKHENYKLKKEIIILKDGLHNE